MGLTRDDLIGDMSDEERASRQEWIDRTSSNDVWAKKIFNKVGILVTSHQSNRPYLKACIDSHKQLGYWITVAYDSFVNPEIPGPEFDKYSWDRFMPAKDVMDNIDMFLITHHQVWGGVLYPWFWLMKWGADLMSQFEYIYCVNGDFIVEKPEGFPELLAYMGDADVMSYGPNSDTSVSTCFIIKSAALKRVMQHVQDHFIPWDVYEKYTMEIGNAEGRFAKAIKDCSLTIKPVDPPYNEQMHLPGQGTWHKLIGFRHIHGEHNYAYRNKGIPPHYKYMDPRFMGDEYNRIKEYWDTGNQAILEGWWAR